MAAFTMLDALIRAHRELVQVKEGRVLPSVFFTSGILTEIFDRTFNQLWDLPPKNDTSRQRLKEDTIEVSDCQYAINEDFRQMAMSFSDEYELDELEAARCLLEALQDHSIGKSLPECAAVRLHRQHRYLLEVIKLLLELACKDDPEDEAKMDLEPLISFVEERLFHTHIQGCKRLVPRSMAMMARVKKRLQGIYDKLTAAQTLNIGTSEEMETVEFIGANLLEQHETLALIICRCIELRQTEIPDFVSLVSTLKAADKYDLTLIHLIPVFGAYTSHYGSTEGVQDLPQARQLGADLFPAIDDSVWSIPTLKAMARAWWVSEYSGFYVIDPPESQIPEGTDLDAEDQQRSKMFLESLKEGAFDLLLSIAADTKSPHWQDTTKVVMRKWLQRKSPLLASESVAVSDDFHACLQSQLEVFVDAFISNLPDVLRKLRTEEAEQRQLSQTHEQDLDLERFLFIVAYAYDGRPDVAARFWTDQTSNLYGFMLWVSKRASTPLVIAFCEMLQAIAANAECATAAHELLLDDGHHPSGKLARSQCLTWSQILKELLFFAEKMKQGPNSTISSQNKYRGAPRPSNDLVESEPESAMMLECYLRLITKLAAESEVARQFLLCNEPNIIVIMFELLSATSFSRLRGCVFTALNALMTRRTEEEGNTMWQYVDFWASGGLATSPAGQQQRQAQQSHSTLMDRTFAEISQSFDSANPLVGLLITLTSPTVNSSSLNDALPFPEILGSSFRAPGIDCYVDFVMGQVFASNMSETTSDTYQARLLRLSCLDFVQQSLTTFNENLILLANATGLAVDSIISSSDLATYVKLHPFARVMEWMFNDRVMSAVFDTVQQSLTEVAKAAPDSPLTVTTMRAIEVISQVLDMQTTYLDLVRPFLKTQTGQRRQPVANAAYASFEDGLLTRIGLVVTLGNYCGIGHPDLVLASLKLMGQMASSTKITTYWSGNGDRSHRNKAIVAMEANREHEAIAMSFVQELQQPIEMDLGADTSAYTSKTYILNFLYECLNKGVRKPTIAHLLLGFKCGVDTVCLEANSNLFAPDSLFHTIAGIFLETQSADQAGMHHAPLALKYRALRVLHALWSSPLTSSFINEELRENNFLFALLSKEMVLQSEIPWEGEDITAPDFTITKGSAAFLDFLAVRCMSFEYIATELCMVSQGRSPSTKRRIVEALNGQITTGDSHILPCPTVFDLYDFVIPEGMWDLGLPSLQTFKGLDLNVCVEKDENGNSLWNVSRAHEILLLERKQSQSQGIVATAIDIASMDREEAMILECLTATNRKAQIYTQAFKVLQAWAKLLLVIIQCSDLEGTAQTTFFLHALQTIQPSLDDFAVDRPEEALELATLTKVLLCKLGSVSLSDTSEPGVSAVGHLVGDKLYQLFQSCLQAVGKWSGTPKLRALYYEICYRYLTGLSGVGACGTEANRKQILRTIFHSGERLMHVASDDAFCGEATCQTAALIFLAGVVALSREEGDNYVTETLNRLNFIGCLVDSFRDIMSDWHNAFDLDQTDQQHFQNARLALLLQLAQTRSGAKYILHSNFLRTIDMSGLFDADPDLQFTQEKPRALEQHYELLSKVIRIIGAALLSRGNSNVGQGRKFLTDHRMLISHVLKRSAGIGTTPEPHQSLEQRVDDLADGLMVIITVTGFLEFEGDAAPAETKPDLTLFH